MTGPVVDPGEKAASRGSPPPANGVADRGQLLPGHLASRQSPRVAAPPVGVASARPQRCDPDVPTGAAHRDPQAFLVGHVDGTLSASGCRHDGSLAPGSDSCDPRPTPGPSGRPPRMGVGRTDQRIASDHEGIHHADIRLRMHAMRRVRTAAIDLGARARAMPELRRHCPAADRRRNRLGHEGTGPFWQALRPGDALLRARDAL